MTVKYISHKEEITEPGTYTLGDTVIINLPAEESNTFYIGFLPDGTEISIG
mgnify:CR=1 FL=1